jgi:hypothetical protein
LFTRFGGVFLLLPDIVFPEWSDESIDSDSNAHRRALGLFTLAVAVRGDWNVDAEMDLTLRQIFGIPRELSLLAVWRTLTPDQREQVAVAARATLAAFAERLPGFSGSQPEYLRRNFLDVSASLECELSRTIVRLSRPPLYVVLAVAGLNRRRYDVPWLSHTPFELFPAD